MSSKRSVVVTINDLLWGKSNVPCWTINGADAPDWIVMMLRQAGTWKFVAGKAKIIISTRKFEEAKP